MIEFCFRTKVGQVGQYIFPLLWLSPSPTIFLVLEVGISLPFGRVPLLKAGYELLSSCYFWDLK